MIRCIRSLLLLIAFPMVGCFGKTDRSWIDDSMGHELVAVKPFPRDPHACQQSTDQWPIGTRLRIAKVLFDNQFLQIEWYHYARVVGDPRNRLYRTDGNDSFIDLPTSPPAWFDANDPRRSARSASMEQLDHEIQEQTTLGRLAAGEVVRRWVDGDDADAARSRFERAMSAFNADATFASAFGELSDAQVERMRADLIAMLTRREKNLGASDARLPYQLALAVDRRLKALSTTRPSVDAKPTR